jgi:RNA polymerase sigma-70 factor, ECF subfamily
MSYAAITEKGPGRGATEGVQQAVHARPWGQRTPPERQRVTVTASRQGVGRGGKNLTDRSHEQQLIALMGRIVAGDRKAFAAFYDATSALVYGVALRVLHDQTIAEEVAIEVYLQVYQQAACFDCRRSNPSAWLLTLTRSRAIDRRRQDAVRLQREASPEVIEQVACPLDPEAYSTALERHRAVQSALASLSPQQRQVITMAYFEGLSHSAIAATLGQPLGTVKTRVRTGLRCLRTLLQPLHTAS